MERDDITTARRGLADAAPVAIARLPRAVDTREPVPRLIERDDRVGLDVEVLVAVGEKVEAMMQARDVALMDSLLDAARDDVEQGTRRLMQRPSW